MAKKKKKSRIKTRTKPAKSYLKLYIFLFLFVVIAIFAPLYLYKDNDKAKTANKSRVHIKSTNIAKNMVKVKLFYYNSKKAKNVDKEMTGNPASIIAVQREITPSRTPIKDTINLLLEGRLTAKEITEGFSTEFPYPDFTLQDATLSKGILTLTFNDPNNFSSGGSARIMMLHNQFIKTAKQFPQVKEVRFKPDYLFQP